MHPLLSQLRRLALYLVAWIPLAALLSYLLASAGGMSKAESIAMAIPLSLVYAFLCLSAWYSCRATPFGRSNVSKFVGTHVSAAVVASVIWTVFAETLAHVLTAMGFFPELKTHFARAIPLLGVTGVLLYLLSVSFYYILIMVQASQEAEARAMEARILARDAELKALKAQVNPHFLFNSLNSISALTSSDSAKAREMCILLGDFLRRTLGLGEKAAIRLDDEMSLIHAFLAVEKIRYGDRIQMEEKIDPQALDVQVLPLLLQPLVENAVVHGIADLVEGGWIRLEAHCQDGDLSILVENNFDPEAPSRRKNGVGLANVRQRLEARYGNRASFHVNTEADRFRVAITLPAEKEACAS